jgi:hypothetical protein
MRDKFFFFCSYFVILSSEWGIVRYPLEKCHVWHQLTMHAIHGFESWLYIDSKLTVESSEYNLEVAEPDPIWEIHPTRSDLIRLITRNNSTLNDPILDPTRPDTTRNKKWPDTQPNPTWYDQKPKMTRYPTRLDRIWPKTRNDLTLDDPISDPTWPDTARDSKWPDTRWSDTWPDLTWYDPTVKFS